MTRRTATWCLHMPDWPEIDRAAWEAAFQEGDWLDGAGPGARLRPETRAKYAEGYGNWLAWLADAGLLDRSARPADRVTPDAVVAYARWMRDRVAPITARMRIEDLAHVLTLIDPHHDRQLFRTLLQRPPSTPVRDKRGKFRDPADLVAEGEALMRAAEAGDFGPPRYNAVAFRDGFLIALAAWRPLQRRNLAGLRIQDHLELREGALRIVIPAEETKTGQPIDMTWPEALRPALDRYLGRWRPILLGAHADPGSLWISRRGGGPIAAHTIACLFRLRTEAAFGVAISPHAFRDAAATMMAIQDPQNVRAAASVLGHASYETTQKHYNLARRLDAVGALHAGIDALLIEEDTE